MALSRMLIINEIRSSRHLLLQNRKDLLRIPNNNTRSFKRVHEENKGFTMKVPSAFENVNVEVQATRFSNLLKPFAFTVAFSASCFTGAAIWQYENMRSHAITMLKQPMGYFHKRTKETHNKLGDFRKQANAWWNGLSAGEKVFVPICFINILVFGAWRIPRLQPIMVKYFCSNPASKVNCWPMLLSTFSHYSAFHLFANMFVLHSCSTAAVASLGKEQFLGLYLSAGVISSFTSYLYKTVTRQPGLSLGASGAIMAILGYVCTEYPQSQLALIFLPFLTFSAGTAVKAAVCLDLAGVILGWKLFDHAAHLGGMGCGILWSYWGNQHLWLNREPILQYWHDLRGAIK